MGHNAETVGLMIRGVSAEQARWRPTATAWSILEVINHLCDEEREDFRVRLDIMLHKPEQPLPEIEPESWVTERAYNQRDLAGSLESFLKERRESIRWLRTFESPDWGVVYKAPRWKMTAGDMFASWVTHDILHMRQLLKLEWLYTTRNLEPYKVDYAGRW